MRVLQAVCIGGALSRVGVIATFWRRLTSVR
jgi:hypothetical protein